MLVLAIETSCDETAVAILRDREILADLISSQNDLHAPYGGVVPELASRRQMEVLPAMFVAACDRAGVSAADVDGIAVTCAPGLIGSLLVGLSFAKAVAFAHGKPLVGVNHLEGHLHAVRVEHPDIAYPYLGLVVSGGHTSLYLVRAFGDYKLLGATRDDAAGEAFDKVAKLLGLGYPGGPLIDRLAAEGNPKAVKFTRPKIDPGSQFEVGEYDFSFSGLKSAVARYVATKSPLPGGERDTCPPVVWRRVRGAADLAASFQRAVVEALCRRLQEAAKATGCTRMVVSGGVAANSGLRARLGQMSEEHGYKIYVPQLRYCTDNAVMIALVGAEYLSRGVRHGMDLNAGAVAELGTLASADCKTCFLPPLRGGD